MTLAEPTTHVPVILSASAAPRELYVRNMSALWRWDPKLALAIEAVHPADLPAIEQSREGGVTARIPIDGGKSIYLHSRYRPTQEAAQWVASLPLDDKYVVIVGGFGLGHHVRALFDRLPSDAIIVVAEPSIPILRAAMESVDLAELLSSGRCLFFTSTNRSELVERLELRSALFVAGMQFAIHAPSAQIAGSFHTDFQKAVTEFVSYTRTGLLTLMLNNVATCRNIANNLGRYATTPTIDSMHNYFAGRPAVLVAAGPSLAKNMHLLPEARAKGAVIIAVQTMLKPLLAAGIEPDFVTSLDYNTVSTRFFENLEEAGSTGRVTLVAEPKANWNVLDVFDGTMALLHNDFAAKLLREPGAQARMGLKPGATVAHLSFYLAEHIGCDPIVLVGQDLGFVDGLYYKPGVAIHETWGVELGRFNSLETKEWERIARSKAILRKIPDIHGHPMYTEEQFFVYLQQFERDFAASRCKIIDATEGGARKQHVATMSFREAIDGFAEKLAVGLAPRASETFPWKNHAANKAEALKHAISLLELRRGEAESMKSICEKTIPLLEQMVESQSDIEKMDKLFIEVDRLRAKVGQDPATFEMVCHLNTIGELKRFHHDLGVRRVGEKDSMERQKRQLLRDIDYVKNLRIGAERLLEIVEAAAARLQRQLSAAESGIAWPREVAGARQ
jgi:hypothetical protein